MKIESSLLPEGFIADEMGEISKGDNFVVAKRSWETDKDPYQIHTCLLIHNDFVVSTQIDLAESINPAYLMYPKKECFKIIKK